MGQKVHPNGFRVGVIRDWESRWFAPGKDYAKFVLEDQKIRDHVRRSFRDAGVSTIEIERAANRVKVTVHTAKPGIIIGKGGAGVDRLRQELEDMTGRQININVVEIAVPELDAQLVAEGIAAQIQRRVAWRRAAKQAIGRVMRAGAKGVKVMLAGRLGGAEMSRREWSAEGSVPLHTLRADIDYGFAEAFTTYGQIGVKVWINRGEVIPERRAEAEPDAVATTS